MAKPGWRDDPPGFPDGRSLSCACKPCTEARRPYSCPGTWPALVSALAKLETELEMNTRTGGIGIIGVIVIVLVVLWLVGVIGR
jgi:hypothetical protein